MSGEERWPRGGGAFEDREDAALDRLLAEAGPRPPLPQEDLDQIAAAVRRAWQQQTSETAPSGRRRRWLAAAAVLAISAGVAGWWSLRETPPPPVVARVVAVHGGLRSLGAANGGATLVPGDALARGARVCATGGEAAGGAALRLLAGAELRLAAGSCVQLTAASEVALESGGLYADTGAAGAGSAADSAAALVVGTPLGEVRDVGTRFTVRLRDGAVEVRVRDGAVTVAREHRAEAGEEVVLHRDGRLERGRTAPYGAGWDWVVAAGGDFSIDGRTVAEVLAWVARETGWRVRYADSEIAAAAAEIVLHGDVPGLAPDEAPQVVLPGAGLAGEVVDGVLVVERAPAR